MNCISTMFTRLSEYLCSALLILFILLCLISDFIAAENYGFHNTTAKANNLSRKRRYVAFPEGSSVSAAICLTVGVIGNPSVSFLSWAVNWGVAYDLPNYSWAKENANGFANYTKAISQRRSRRDLYEKIEVAIENMGFNGKLCVERALCEGAKFSARFRKRRGNMIEEIIKTIFTLPDENVAHSEPKEHYNYDQIFRRSKREVQDCSKEYPQCHFSLLELALGKYALEKINLPIVPFM